MSNSHLVGLLLYQKCEQGMRISLRPPFDLWLTAVKAWNVLRLSEPGLVEFLILMQNSSVDDVLSRLSTGKQMTPQIRERQAGPRSDRGICERRLGNGY